VFLGLSCFGFGGTGPPVGIVFGVSDQLSSVSMPLVDKATDPSKAEGEDGGDSLDCEAEHGIIRFFLVESQRLISLLKNTTRL
jgi:hypothetical protein